MNRQGEMTFPTLDKSRALLSDLNHGGEMESFLLCRGNDSEANTLRSSSFVSKFHPRAAVGAKGHKKKGKNNLGNK